VLDELLRMSAELGPVATWLAIFFAAVIAVFVLYIGIALHVVLHTPDEPQQQVRYQIFRDLLSLFDRRKQQ
jgi:hypothetical protein